MKKPLTQFNTATFQCWYHMNWRCQKDPNWAGRGIKVHPRWRKSFLNFLEDMGERPDGLTLDRINNDGHYSPKNCRWATWKEQNRNRRNCIFVTYQGEKRHMADLAEEYGIEPNVLANRIAKGWALEKALTEPLQERTHVHYRGRKRLLSELAREFGINESTLRSRIFLYGWTVEKALETAVAEPVWVEYQGRKRQLAELAQEQGIQYATLWARIYELGWDVSKAVEKPLQKHAKRGNLKESAGTL